MLDELNAAVSHVDAPHFSPALNVRAVGNFLFDGIASNAVDWFVDAHPEYERFLPVMLKGIGHKFALFKNKNGTTYNS